MKIKPSKSRIAFQIFNYTLMLLATFVCVYPFWYIVIYTFSDAAKAGIKNPVFLPRGFSVSNYVDIFKLSGFFPALGISVLRTVVGTVAAVLVCSFLGYMFTKEEMPGRKFMYRFLVMTMYINGGLISTFIVMKSYGLFEYLLDLYPAHDDFRIQYCADKDLHGIAPGLPGGIRHAGRSRVYQGVHQHYPAAVKTHYCDRCGIRGCGTLEFLVR